MKYGYEYMGASSRLIVTPLTDRCWMTITTTLSLQLGVGTSGPSAVGKTETTKVQIYRLGLGQISWNYVRHVQLQSVD